MTRLALLIAVVSAAAPAAAGSLVANRAIQARTVVAAEDLRLAEITTPGALSDPAAAEGMEARVTIYPGRPIRPGDLVEPALVERNQIVTIRYAHGPLEISTDGRALDRGALGERVRVMNLASRSVVVGSVSGAADVSVSR